MARPVLKFLLTTFLLAGGTLADAKPASWRTGFSDLQESLNQLTAIKKSYQLPSEEKKAVEMTARQAAFNRVLDLAQEELGSIRGGLEKLTPSDKFKYLNTITEYQSYHEIIRGQINKEIGLEEIIDIAAKFKKWRETVYNKEVVEMIDFVSITKGQEAIKVAKNRLERILRDFEIIKSYLAPNEWSRAERLVDEAKNFIDEAERGEAQMAARKITAAYKNFIALSKMIQ